MDIIHRRLREVPIDNTHPEMKSDIGQPEDVCPRFFGYGLNECLRHTAEQ